MTTANASGQRTATWLVGASLGYNSIECVVAIAAGLLAASTALVGFGLDSAIEVSASAAVLLHMMTRSEEESAWEHRAAMFIGLTFVGLAIYVGFEAVNDLATSSKPAASYFGIGLAVASLAIMPGLAIAKHRLAHQINSRALEAESRETLVCSYLSAALLLGLVANAALDWWWADPVAALVIVAFLAKEGWEAFTRRELCGLD